MSDIDPDRRAVDDWLAGNGGIYTAAVTVLAAVAFLIYLAIR